jgi:hypothetical protein
MAVFPSEKSCLSYCQCITLQALFNRTELASGARSGSYFPFCHPQLSPRVLTPCSRSQHADATVTPTWLLLSATARLRHRPLFTCFCRGAYEARLHRRWRTPPGRAPGRSAAGRWSGRPRRSCAPARRPRASPWQRSSASVGPRVCTADGERDEALGLAAEILTRPEAFRPIALPGGVLHRRRGDELRRRRGASRWTAGGRRWTAGGGEVGRWRPRRGVAAAKSSGTVASAC